MENMQPNQTNPIDNPSANPQPMNPTNPPAPNFTGGNAVPILPPRRKPWGKIILVILAIILVLVLGGGIYAYLAKIGPFAAAPYTEKDFLSGILTAASKIKSSSYSVSASLSMGERDEDAQPFVSKITDTGETKKKYEDDSTRAKDITGILSSIKYRSTNDPFPASLQALSESNANYYGTFSIKDPQIQQPYNYTITEGGKNFALTVTFETYDAVSAVKSSYNFSASKTIINGKAVTFTKDSEPYLYLSPEAPKPFLVGLAEYLAYLPPETKISSSVKAQADWGNKDSADWKFNIDAQGDLGDMTYKANMDALRKDDIYYLRINNIPTLFIGFIGVEKGQWIKIDPNAKSSDTSSSIGSGIPDAEKYYKEHREELTSLIKKIIEIADNQGLISFKNPPRSENVGGRQLSRYELQINKGNIVPFYRSLQDELEKSTIKNDYPMLVDSGYIDYLQSPDFSEMFDYYQKNTSLTVWVDSQGYPAAVDYNIRVVPQDSAAQLKDKQANLVFRLEIGDINKPVDITAPKDSKTLEDVFKSSPLYESSQKAKDASIEANLSQLVVQGEVYYESNGSSYADWCSSDKYSEGKKNIDTAYGTGSQVACSCDTGDCKSAKAWCTSALLSGGGYYCVDSTGKKTESTDANLCSNGACK